MKKISFICAVSIFILFSSCTKTNTKTVTVTVTDTITKTIIDTLNDVNLSSGLIAYYPFNGNANDTSGNNLNGTITGGVTFSNDVAGNPNSAATFDGSTGYILVPDNANLFQTNAVTVSFLVNLTNPSNRQAFVSNINFNDASGLSYSVQIGAVNFPKFGVANDSVGCTIVSNDPNSVIYSADPMAPNKWYHFLCIFSDSLQEFFVNGTLNTAVTRDFANLNHCGTTKQLVIGAWWSGDLIPLSGSIDELRIYNRALNQDEINKLAKAVQ
jgi:Concanavalin A-like lectin/glucanases superfamily